MRPKSQSFAGAIIQSIFDHFNFLVVNVFHRPLGIAPGFVEANWFKLRHLSRGYWQVADSSSPQLRPVEYIQWAQAVGCG